MTTTITTNKELALKLNRITSNGLNRLESGGKIATLVESVRVTVDTKTLKERYADIAAECSKTSTVKYIRVK